MTKTEDRLRAAFEARAAATQVSPRAWNAVSLEVARRQAFFRLATAGTAVVVLATGLIVLLHPGRADKTVITPATIAPTTSSVAPEPSSAPPTRDCSGAIPPDGIKYAISYVDFVFLAGTSYINISGRPDASVRAADLGPVVAHVRCRLAGSDSPPTYQPISGDAAYVATGDPVYSLRGWPVGCRLAARHDDGRLYVYLAQQPGSDVSRPKPCATSHP